MAQAPLAHTRVVVRVPATSANLGPGFDCLGIALNLFNDLTVTAATEFSMTCEGEGAGQLPLDASNLVVEGAKLAFRAAGYDELPPLAFHLVNRIPIAAGLGSSSAAIVAGLLAGQVLTGKQLPVEREEAALQLASQVEGHVDNLAPCIYGGLQIGVYTGSRWYSTAVGVSASTGLQCVLFVPDQRQSTHGARAVLPPVVPRADAVFNIGRVALLVHALLTGAVEDLALATQDRLHQPARAGIMPALEPCIAAALAAGARGACLSGAGSSVLALTTGRKGDVYSQRPAERSDVARAMKRAAAAVGMRGRCVILEPSSIGAHVLEVDGLSAVQMGARTIDEEDEDEDGDAEGAALIALAPPLPPAPAAPAAAAAPSAEVSMRYVSTRHSPGGGGGDASVSFSEAVFAGVAPDGGLYVPASPALPRLPAGALERWAADGALYADVAFAVLRLFVRDDEVPAADLRRLCDETYRGGGSGGGAAWDHAEVAPLVPLDVAPGSPHAPLQRQPGQRPGRRLWVLEQFHGPTCAFKDHALQLLGRLFALLQARGGAGAPARMTVLGATSGDTGSAAIAGLRGLPGVSVVILHPAGGVAPVQAQQMTTVLDANVHNVAVGGGATFDDCQSIVKAAFRDEAFRSRHSLSAINSINWARVLAQIVYYAWAYVQWLRTDEGRASAAAASAAGAPPPLLRVCVPTGNFGNALSGHYARLLGVPLAPIHVATNANDVLHRFISRGDHALATPVATLAPSMDIQVASNLERYLFLAARATGAADPAALIRTAMGALRGPGGGLAEALPPPLLAALRADFTSSAADDARIDATIARYAAAPGAAAYALCPHTATAVDGAEGLAAAAAGAGAEDLPTVVLATAHPAKFAAGTPALASRGLYAEVYGGGARRGGGAEAQETQEERPPLPPQLRGLASRPSRCVSLALPPLRRDEEGTCGLAEVMAVVDALLL